MPENYLRAKPWGRCSSHSPRPRFDIRLTMNTYSDPRIFDLAGAVETLPALTDKPAVETVVATGTDGEAGRRVCGITTSAVLGQCPAVIGNNAGPARMTLTLAGDGDWQQKTPSGRDGEKQRAKGFEPSTLTLGTSRSTN
jgi:hypothetical protein